MNFEEEQTFSPLIARIFPRKQLKKEIKSRNEKIRKKMKGFIVEAQCLIEILKNEHWKKRIANY